jgi:hypothetical protein
MPKRSSNSPRRRKLVRCCWTAEPMIAEGPRKGEPSRKTMRNGLCAQPALSVRGSSRRIMALRFRPAYISVINRRASAEAVIGSAVQAKPKPLPAHQQDVIPPKPPIGALLEVPERCSQARVRYAAPNPGAPLPAARRSGEITMRWAAPAGSQVRPSPRKTKHRAHTVLDRVAPYQFSVGFCSM